MQRNTGVISWEIKVKEIKRYQVDKDIVMLRIDLTKLFYLGDNIM